MDAVGLTSYNVTTGYNKILLATPIMNAKKGYMVVIDLNSYSARLALDTSGNSFYQDYQISSANLSTLNASYNSRFYFNCLVDRLFYINSFNFGSDQYPSNGIYDLSASFVNSTFYSNVSISVFTSIFIITIF